MNPHIVTAVFEGDEPVRSPEEVDEIQAALENAAFELGLRLVGLSADIERRRAPRVVTYPEAA